MVCARSDAFCCLAFKHYFMIEDKLGQVKCAYKMEREKKLSGQAMWRWISGKTGFASNNCFSFLQSAFFSRLLQALYTRTKVKLYYALDYKILMGVTWLISSSLWLTKFFPMVTMVGNADALLSLYKDMESCREYEDIQVMWAMIQSSCRQNSCNTRRNKRPSYWRFCFRPTWIV